MQLSIMMIKAANRLPQLITQLAIWTLICGTVVLTIVASGQVNEQRRDFPGYFRNYLQAYANAELPKSAAEFVAVIGMVNKPGTVIPEKPKLTLTRAVDEAGGFAPFADHAHVGIWRNDDGRFLIVDTYAIRDGKSPDIVLLKGDIVIVTGRRMDGI